MASRARLSPFSRSSSSSSRMSLVRPLMPSRPDCLFRSVSICSMENPSFPIRNSMMAGSISPERVPITSPSSGVIPMEVSTECPSRIAAIEQPDPRCMVITFTFSRGIPSSVR